MTQNNTSDNVEVRKAYYKSGALWRETPFVSGKEHWIERGYYESGALKYETPFVNGNIHGIAKYYDKDNLNINCLTIYKMNREILTVCLESYGTVSTKS